MISPREQGAFAHTTACQWCGQPDPWGFECCQDCADRLAEEFAEEDA